MWIVYQAEKSQKCQDLFLWKMKLEMCPKDMDAPAWKT